MFSIEKDRSSICILFTGILKIFPLYYGIWEAEGSLPFILIMLFYFKHFKIDIYN